MPHSTRAAAHLEPPSGTDIQPRFVSTHPSRGWDDDIEHEAHRTLLHGITSQTFDFDDTHLKDISDIALRTAIREIAVRSRP